MHLVRSVVLEFRESSSSRDAAEEEVAVVAVTF